MSMSLRSRIGLLFVAGFIASSMDACGGSVENNNPVCKAGQTQSCPAGCVGQKVCAANGKSFVDQCSCGTGGSSGSPTGGFGGVPSGGFGGVPPSGGFGGVPPSGGFGGVPPTGGVGGGGCGGCPSYTLAGIIQMASCCAPGGCGATVDSQISSLIAIGPGCYLTNSPGSPDPSCPQVSFINPITNQPAAWNGCCRADTSLCGVLVDLSSQQGPVLGCIDPNGSGGGAGGGQPCSNGQGCNACVSQKCAQEVANCQSDPACAALLSCVSGCPDQVCVDKCTTTFPNGKPLFDPILQCIQTNCWTECV